jgi:acyl CoA:acetate/3-ketoacid CoA transferase beta subunit
MKARASEVLKSVQETNWQSELSQFSKEVQDDAKAVSAKAAAEAAEHIARQVGQVMQEGVCAVFFLGAAQLKEQGGHSYLMIPRWGHVPVLVQFVFTIITLG